jgi:hypothetical protein
MHQAQQPPPCVDSYILLFTRHGAILQEERGAKVGMVDGAKEAQEEDRYSQRCGVLFYSQRGL